MRNTPANRFLSSRAESCADRRDWVIGTPDDGIAWIEQKLEETGGFGGLLLHCPEWCDHQKATRSMEMFARYVMPHFQGHNATFKDEWRIIKERTEGGRIAYDTGSRPGNLTARDPNAVKAPQPKAASGE